MAASLQVRKSPQILFVSICQIVYDFSILPCVYVVQA